MFGFGSTQIFTVQFLHVSTNHVEIILSRRMLHLNFSYITHFKIKINKMRQFFYEVFIEKKEHLAQKKWIIPFIIRVIKNLHYFYSNIFEYANK